MRSPQAAHSRNGSVITHRNSQSRCLRESPPLYAGPDTANQGKSTRFLWTTTEAFCSDAREDAATRASRSGRLPGAAPADSRRQARCHSSLPIDARATNDRIALWSDDVFAKANAVALVSAPFLPEPLLAVGFGLGRASDHSTTAHPTFPKVTSQLAALRSSGTASSRELSALRSANATLTADLAAPRARDARLASAEARGRALLGR